MNYTTSNRYAVPQSFITRSKQRLKQHVDTVYMNNGDEFEIELYNPTPNKVLAKIELNGKSIGNGIIVRPGERIFLERYLDEARKFLFETYLVNGDNQEVQKSIENNGDVVVRFYDEKTLYPYYDSYTIPNWNGSFNGNLYNSVSTPLNYPPGVRTITSSLPGTIDVSNSFVNTTGIIGSTTKKFKSKDIETGRVEKGSQSDQSFVYDNSKFNSFPIETNWWKIKPNSTKVMVREDLTVYCTECGSKRKKDSHKFCPHCGTKY